MPRSTCGACHAVFTTTRAFEMHRVDRFNPRERRCLTPAEMQARGMSQNGRGQWMMPASDHSPFWTQAEEYQSESASSLDLRHDLCTGGPQL